MHHIGNICVERSAIAPPDKKYWKFGELWYDKEMHNAWLNLFGWADGLAICKPFDGMSEPPYIKGDLLAWSGNYIGDTLEKEYMVCGFIYTESDQRGCIYQVILKINPLMCQLSHLVERIVKKEKTRGMHLKVQMEDK